MTVKSWSYSKLTDFEKCRRMFWLKHHQRVPEPERPLPPGKTEHANDRGTRIHAACEAYINGTTDELTFEAAKFFGPQIDLLRVLYEKKHVFLEGEWGMSSSWDPTPWDAAWLRLKLDVLVLLDGEAVVIDFKTGRKFGNEIKHAEQMQLYAVCTALRYPKLRRITSELWYLDNNETSRLVFTREQALRCRNGFDIRGKTIMIAKEFPTRASKYTCQWCPYNNEEHCPEGYR